MFYKEAKKIYQLITKVESKKSVILNLGSSTKKFREIDQPYINSEIFTKLSLDGYKVIHSDIKENEGVDLVGDILDLSFRQKIAKINPSIIICSNLLEHIEERNSFITALLEIVPENSYIIITVPYKFPYHPDPIDTLYRPSLNELENDICIENNLKLISGEILNNSLLVNFNVFNQFKRLQNLLRLFIRFFLPFYKYKNWEIMFLKNSIYAKVTIGLFKKIKK